MKSDEAMEAIREAAKGPGEECFQTASVDGIELKIHYYEYKEAEKVDLHRTANEIRRKLHVEVLKDRRGRVVGIFHYDFKQGFYRQDGERRIREVAEQIFMKAASTNLKNELLAHISDFGFQYLDKWQASGLNHIVVNNGTLNLAKASMGDIPLEPHSPEFHCLNKLNVDFDSGATADILINHLNRVMPSVDDQLAFQKFIGSMLDSASYSHQKVLFLYGAEGSGKTVTLKVFVKFFGEDNIRGKTLQELSENRFATADLFSAFANVCEELPQKSIVYLERLNRLTGGWVEGEHKNGRPFGFYQNAKIAVACNDLPKINAEQTTVRAFMSRLLIIVFNQTIRGTDSEVANYDEVLLNQKSGLLNWILAGYAKYRQDGGKIKATRTTDDTLEYYIANSDFVQFFADGCTESGDREKDFVLLEELWQAYLDEAKKRKVKTVVRQTFLSTFPQKFKGSTAKARQRVPNSTNEQRLEYVFPGVKLLPPERRFGRENGVANIDKEEHANQVFLEAGTPLQVGTAGTKSAKGGEDVPAVPTSDPLPASRKVENPDKESHGEEPVETAILGILKSARGEYLEQSIFMLSSTLRSYGHEVSPDSVKAICERLLSIGKLRVRNEKYSAVLEAYP